MEIDLIVNGIDNWAVNALESDHPKPLATLGRDEGLI